MNCKPGDLAIVVRMGDPLDGLLGRIVEVATLEYLKGDPVWNLKEQVQVAVKGLCVTHNGSVLEAGKIATIKGIADKYLKPLRGDTADAEEAHKEKETA